MGDGRHQRAPACRTPISRTFGHTRPRPWCNPSRRSCDQWGQHQRTWCRPGRSCLGSLLWKAVLVRASLRVVKRPARDDLVFDFLLDYEGARADAQRYVERRRYDQLLPALQALHEHVSEFREPTKPDSIRRYRAAVNDWL